MASGGGGTFAVQLASLAGHHHVTATYAVRNLDLVRGLGADEALDYNTPEGAALRGLSGRKHDVVMHCTEGVVGVQAGAVGRRRRGGGPHSAHRVCGRRDTAVVVLLEEEAGAADRVSTKKEDMDALLGLVICDFREDWVNLVNYARKVRIFMTGKYTISQDEIVPFLSPRLLI
ncbi:hypothetical protein ACQ4PT_043868 [Festuca glaucescens]